MLLVPDSDFQYILLEIEALHTCVIDQVLGLKNGQFGSILIGVQYLD